MSPRVETHEEELELRCRDVLREIVMQYIATGEPISSRSLAKSGRFHLSPASLRNVMADLEDTGYLYQPHTSAGRVPTDRGYRFFINHLMRSRKLTPHEKEEIDGGVAKTNEIDEVMQLSSRLLSKLSDQVGVVFMPTLQQLSMRTVDLILVAERKIMVVIVGTNGVVVNRMIDTQVPFSREELERISRYISTEFSGMTLSAIRDTLSAKLADERARNDSAHRNGLVLGIEALDDALPLEHELFMEGASSILKKPEFSDAESLRKTMLLFEEREKLVDILNRCIEEDGLQIVIGSESRFTQSYNFSLVATRYGSRTTPVGMVGVIGPTRMEYARMAPLVDYLGRALSRKIEESCEENES